MSFDGLVCNGLDLIQLACIPYLRNASSGHGLQLHNWLEYTQLFQVSWRDASEVALGPSHRHTWLPSIAEVQSGIGVKPLMVHNRYIDVLVLPR